MCEKKKNIRKHGMRRAGLPRTGPLGGCAPGWGRASDSPIQNEVIKSEKGEIAMKSKCGAALLLMLVLVMAYAGALAEDTYTVTFDVNNEVPDLNNPSGTITIPIITESDPVAKSVTAGETVTTPTDPTADGYVFGGWYTDVNCTSAYDFNTPVQQNYTLYAKWMLAVTFDANEPNSSTTVDHMPDPRTVNVPIGAPVGQPADPTAEGYTFGGWYTTAQCKDNEEYDFSTKVTNGFTLYAKWTQNKYTVKFDLQDTSITTKIPDKTVTHGATVAAPDPAPSKTGYTFGGWYKEPTCATEFKFTNGQSNETVTSNITLYAKWSIKQYRVTFDNQGHGIQPPQQMVNHDDTAKNPGDLVEQGYRFEGWYTDLNNASSQYHFTEAVTAPVTLHAKWTTLHTVTFDMNGHGAVIKPVTVDDGGTVSAPVPAPTAEGYAFGGWYTNQDCTGNAVTFTETISKDTTYHAKWTATVKVTFQWQKAMTNTGAAPTAPATVQLLGNGAAVSGANELTVQPNVEGEWTGLAADVKYSVKATNVPANYTAVCTRTGENTFLITYVENEKLSVTITNTHAADTIDMVISKFWDDNNNQHRPRSIQVQVMKVVNGTKEPVKDKNGNGIVLTLNDSNQWTAHVTDLYMRENGKTIQYIIEEIGDVKGYKATCEIVVDAQGNYTVRVTNVLTGKVDISGKKIWYDDNDRDGIRPQSVQLKIYENSLSTLVKNVIVDANGSTGNEWTWTVEDLPVYDEFGRPITYIVVEDPVPAGYTASAPQYITVGTTGP